MLANPGALKKMRRMDPNEERYVRRPRDMSSPRTGGMPHCTSNLQYLWPTRWCNHREPLVIAMANELGAYELSDWEFAEAVYWFVKTKFVVELPTLQQRERQLEERHRDVLSHELRDGSRSAGLQG